MAGCDNDAETSAPPSKTAAEPDGATPPPAEEGSGPNAKLAADAAKAVKSVPAEHRSALAARALVEIEKDRLPASLVEGLESLADAPAEMRAVLLAKSISANLSLLDKACDTNAAELMTSLSSMAPDARAQKVWSTCKLERHGIMTEADRATSDPMLALVAHMVAMKIGTPSEDEKTVLRGLMTPG